MLSSICRIYRLELGVKEVIEKLITFKEILRGKFKTTKELF